MRQTQLHLSEEDRAVADRLYARWMAGLRD